MLYPDNYVLRFIHSIISIGEREKKSKLCRTSNNYFFSHKSTSFSTCSFGSRTSKNRKALFSMAQKQPALMKNISSKQAVFSNLPIYASMILRCRRDQPRFLLYILLPPVTRSNEEAISRISSSPIGVLSPVFGLSASEVS